ncbi:MAG: hypothetical protein ABF636_13425, partial [Acetobacter sp.]
SVTLAKQATTSRMKTKVWLAACHGKELFKNLPGETLVGFFEPAPEPEPEPEPYPPVCAFSC